MTFEEAKNLFHKCRNPFKGKPLKKKNTVLYPSGNCFVIRYYNTEIIKIYPKDIYEINLKGYNTRSTKDRIKHYAPISLYQYKGNVFIYQSGVKIPFKDGMKFNGHGRLIGDSIFEQIINEFNI